MSFLVFLFPAQRTNNISLCDSSQNGMCNAA